FFFFQAEDGIRDYKVTGVQTCALPISRLRPSRRVSTLTHQCWQPLQKFVFSPRAVSSEIRWPQRGQAPPPLPWTAMKLRSCLCEIGRASCRERVYVVEVGVRLK